MDGDPGPWTVAMTPRMRMRGGRTARTAVAGAASLALHLLFLAAMVLGLRAIRPPPEPPAIELQILPPFTLSAPAAARAAPPPRRARPVPQPPLKPHLAPRPRPVQAPPLVLPPPPAPKREQAGPLLPEEGDNARGMRPSVTGRLGCDDPISFHLTDAQRARCENNVGRLAQAAPRLAPNISDANMKAFDRAARCHAAASGAMPSSAGESGGGGGIPGLGYAPSLRECPPGDR